MKLKPQMAAILAAASSLVLTTFAANASLNHEHLDTFISGSLASEAASFIDHASANNMVAKVGDDKLSPIIIEIPPMDDLINGYNGKNVIAKGVDNTRVQYECVCAGGTAAAGAFGGAVGGAAAGLGGIGAGAVGGAAGGFAEGVHQGLHDGSVQRGITKFGKTIDRPPNTPMGKLQ